MQNEKTIELQANLTFGDFYRATLAMMLHALRFLIVGIVALLFVFLICLVVGNTDFAWRDSAFGVAQWLYPIVLAAVPTVVVGIPAVTLIRVKQILGNKTFQLHRRYRFSEGGIRVETELATAEVRWGAYREIRENRRYFLMYATPGLANIVPRRCFGTKDALSDFRALVRSNVPKYKLRGD